MRYPMVPWVAAMACLAATLVSGCSEGTTGATPPPDTPLEPTSMTLSGAVVDAALRPIADAVVTLDEGEDQQTTLSDGAFAFQDLAIRAHTLRVDAAGFLPGYFPFAPGDESEGLFLPLEILPSLIPTNHTLEFAGSYECALETFILTGSCDAVAGFANDNLEPQAGRPLPEPFVTNATFEVPLPSDWATVVVDVHFEEGAYPGTQGLRLVADGTSSAGEAGTYVTYGRFNDTAPFSARIEPGEQYPEGDVPVPSNATILRLKVYPQSHLWHAACVPGYDCLLGVGAGTDIRFTVFATVFRIAPAPEGFTLLDA